MEAGRQQGPLVAELIDATRLQSGRLALTMTPVNLAAVVSRAVELAQVLAEGHTLDLEVGDEPLMVMGDAGRLGQA